jgi:hyperosmotically inducible protein
MNRIVRMVLAGLLGTMVLSGPALASSAQDQAERKQRDPAKYEAWLKKEVRHQLVMLPYYSVFDNLTYEIQDDKVILGGQVVRPTLKSDAEAAVKGIEGVSQVVNNIEVLPLSTNDDRIRRAVFRAIFRDTVLSKYGFQAVPPIHIIVKNGHVTLEGVVDSAMDKNVANIRANAVPGVFSVTNNLKVVKS